MSASTATLSSDGKFRYDLVRVLPPELAIEREEGYRDRALFVSAWRGRTLLFVMLNPSIADASKDDPTIRKCLGFTRRAGYERLAVVNLFAFRATDPRQRVLARSWDELVGPENDATIARWAQTSDAIVGAWGAYGDQFPHRVRALREILAGAPRKAGVYTLGFTGGGQPRHPLMLPYSTVLVPWPDVAPERIDS